MPRSKLAKRSAKVVDLSEVRARLRLASYQDKVARVLDSNRDTINGLCQSGMLFSRPGAKAGRDLLLAHLNLLKMVSLVNQLSDLDDIPAPRRPADGQVLYEELDGLLTRTAELTTRTGTYLARL
ncbi:MAG TPA: hypothetical protein VEY30_08740, partial [Myxococcaceae bacterium]|nr:hypothetical protein [Myxococcaceae bacterium]